MTTVPSGATFIMGLWAPSQAPENPLGERRRDKVLSAVTGLVVTLPLSLWEVASFKGPGLGQRGSYGPQPLGGQLLLQKEAGSPGWGLASAKAEP